MMCRRSHAFTSLRVFVTLVSLPIVAACGTSVPTSSPVRVPPSQASNNQATIASLTTNSPRVEAGGEVQVTAVVEEASTPALQRAYE